MLDNLQDVASKAWIAIWVIDGVAIVVYHVATALVRQMSVSSSVTGLRLARAYLVIVPLGSERKTLAAAPTYAYEVTSSRTITFHGMSPI